MNKKSWLTGLFIIILASIAIIARIYYINALMLEVNINEEIYNAAKVSVGTNGLKTVFADGIHIESLYICNLYFAFLIFGNFTVAGVYLNVVYQVLTVLLVYIVLKNLTNRYIGFAGSLILAIFPMYIESLSQVTMFHMMLLLGAMTCTIVVLIVRLLFCRHTAKDSKEEQQRMSSIPDAVTNQKETEDTACALPDTSMKEIHYDDLDKVQYIENPLPVPKRKEHKEMDYAFEPTDNDDDYDVKDITGKDYYDIE